MCSKAKMLSKMIALAAVKHADQFDRAGKPYFLHVCKVMHYLKTEDEELQCIAIGHDLLEDTDVTIASLREAGISERVIVGIQALTKMPGETPDEYKARVKANADAIKVKMCDLRHNSDIRRLKGITEKDIQRTIKYQEFYKELRELVCSDL